ncbi:MAG: tRNA pseudouridine(55) synthase TruB [Cyanobacteriota bacterium]|nr:tRNA pseudouridine(55) synthase TruB [Cyanobacteriota bacterium]
MAPQGFLNLYKPAGLTSHDCVAIVRKVLHTRKVGHAGTLDPAAMGVLPIAVGRATRFLSFLEGSKGYRATFILGKSSSTDDLEGEIGVRDPCPHLTQAQVEAALASFVGTIQQMPPLYSAVRQQGQHLYELARQGSRLPDLTVAPRRVTIERLQVVGWRQGDYPEVDLEIACGTGTYIRAIARDLGEMLGSGGLMSQLIRCQSGAFCLTDSVPLASWREDPQPAAALLPIADAFPHLGVVKLAEDLAVRWCYGQGIPWWDESASGFVRVLAATSGIFLGLGQISEQRLLPVRVLENLGGH